MLEREVCQLHDEAPRAEPPLVAVRNHPDRAKPHAWDPGLAVAETQTRLDECARMTRRLGDLLMTLRQLTVPADAVERAPTHRSL